MFYKKPHPFYKNSKWIACRNAYMKKVHYVCEKCGRPADVVHHKKFLKKGDYFVNTDKCYGEWNLQALCHECHNNIHYKKQNIAKGYRVNMRTGEVEKSPP